MCVGWEGAFGWLILPKEATPQVGGGGDPDPVYSVPHQLGVCSLPAPMLDYVHQTYVMLCGRFKLMMACDTSPTPGPGTLPSTPRCVHASTFPSTTPSLPATLQGNTADPIAPIRQTSNSRTQKGRG